MSNVNTLTPIFIETIFYDNISLDKQGEKFQVEFYFTKTGKIPAKEYLEKARNMKKAYADRIKGGIYYEKN